MTKNELFTFIKNFNATQSVSPKTILEGLKTLPESDHELFMLLVNYKVYFRFSYKLLFIAEQPFNNVNGFNTVVRGIESCIKR